MLQLRQVSEISDNLKYKTYFEVRLLMTLGSVSYCSARANIEAIPGIRVRILQESEVEANYLFRNQSRERYLQG